MLLDIVLFKINFSPLQLTGLILVLGMFLIIITFAYMRQYKDPEDPPETEEDKGQSN